MDHGERIPIQSQANNHVQEACCHHCIPNDDWKPLAQDGVKLISDIHRGKVGLFFSNFDCFGAPYAAISMHCARKTGLNIITCSNAAAECVSFTRNITAFSTHWAAYSVNVWRKLRIFAQEIHYPDTIGLPVPVHVKLDFGVVCDWITSLRNLPTRARMNLPRNPPPFVCVRARSYVAVKCSTVPRVAQRLCRKPKCFFKAESALKGLRNYQLSYHRVGM